MHSKLQAAGGKIHCLIGDIYPIKLNFNTDREKPQGRKCRINPMKFHFNTVLFRQVLISLFVICLLLVVRRAESKRLQFSKIITEVTRPNKDTQLLHKHMA
jgi:hypothetical protein